nr:hypothetical protein GCM10020093_091410 [Planobispora longispora]
MLAGLTHGEQAAGLTWLWGPLGRALATLPHADVLADCGRLGGHPELGDLITEAALTVLFTRASLDHVAHLRERLQVIPRGTQVGVVVISDPGSTAPRSTRSAGSWGHRQGRRLRGRARARPEGRGTAARAVGRASGPLAADPHRP